MNPNVKELLKSVHICQSYRKNKSGMVYSKQIRKPRSVNKDLLRVRSLR